MSGEFPIEFLFYVMDRLKNSKKGVEIKDRKVFMKNYGIILFHN